MAEEKDKAPKVTPEELERLLPEIMRLQRFRNTAADVLARNGYEELRSSTQQEQEQFLAIDKQLFDGHLYKPDFCAA